MSEKAFVTIIYRTTSEVNYNYNLKFSKKKITFGKHAKPHTNPINALIAKFKTAGVSHAFVKNTGKPTSIFLINKTFRK